MLSEQTETQAKDAVSKSDQQRVVINRYPDGTEPLMICGDNMSMRTLKICYRKHAKGDDSIGWDELSDKIGDALAQTMGDDEFCKWLESL